jgi:site-specific DNA recombinase
MRRSPMFSRCGRTDATEQQRKGKFLLSALIECACCGSGMSTKYRDHGRVRIHRTTTREAGACSNRKIFSMDEIERALHCGLLKAQHLLKQFVEAYQQERQRLASKRIRRRSHQIENELAQLQRSIDRLWDDQISERIPVDIAGAQAQGNEVSARSLGGGKG